MNLGSWLLLGVVAVWLVVALVHIVRNRGNCCGCASHRGNQHGCCGDCANCGGRHCVHEQNQNNK